MIQVVSKSKLFEWHQWRPDCQLGLDLDCPGSWLTSLAWNGAAVKNNLKTWKKLISLKVEQHLLTHVELGYGALGCVVCCSIASASQS